MSPTEYDYEAECNMIDEELKSEKEQAIDNHRKTFADGFLFGRKELMREIEAYIAKRGFRESSFDLEEVRKWIKVLVKEEE